MKEEELAAVIYLWTRDAGMPVDLDTEAYVATHLRFLKDKASFQFSDKAREVMARSLARDSKLV